MPGDLILEIDKNPIHKNGVWRRIKISTRHGWYSPEFKKYCDTMP